MNKTKLVGSLLLILLVKFLPAQNDTLYFSLMSAQEHAMAHNKQLMNAKEDIALSEAQYKETRAQGLPQVSGSMDYMTNFNYEVEFDFGMSGGNTMPDINTSVLDEGDMEILNMLNEMFAPTGPATIVMEDQANAKLQVSQLIFSGQYWVGIETAKIYKQLTKTQYQKTEKDIKEQVANTYYLILVSEASLEIINKNLANLRSMLNHTQNMYAAGLVEKSDVDQLRMNVSQLENSREATRRNVQLSYNMLRIQLGLEAGSKIALEEELADLLESLETNILGEELTVENNLTYQLVDVQEKMNEQQVALEKWSFAPTLVGFYSYTEKIMTTGFDLSPKNAAGLTLSVPIFSGGQKKARVDQARIELEKTRRNKSLLEDQLNLQENQLQYDLRSALDNYHTQKENVEVAKSVYDNIFNKYKQGLVSSLDLTQANTNYLQAENNYISSALQVLQAKLALKKLYNIL